MQKVRTKTKTLEYLTAVTYRIWTYTEYVSKLS